MTFEHQNDFTNALPVRLLIGVYASPNIARCGENVWAYAIPLDNQNWRYAAPIEMHNRERHGLAYIQTSVDWNDLEKASEDGSIEMAPVFQQVASDEELKAVIKWCFLATEINLLGLDQHCIPTNKTFISELENVCQHCGEGWQRRRPRAPRDRMSSASGPATSDAHESRPGPTVNQGPSLIEVSWSLIERDATMTSSADREASIAPPLVARTSLRANRRKALLTITRLRSQHLLWNMAPGSLPTTRIRQAFRPHGLMSSLPMTSLQTTRAKPSV